MSAKCQKRTFPSANKGHRRDAAGRAWNALRARSNGDMAGSRSVGRAVGSTRRWQTQNAGIPPARRRGLVC
jgi:hypothetical protein